MTTYFRCRGVRHYPPYLHPENGITDAVEVSPLFTFAEAAKGGRLNDGKGGMP